MKFVIANLKMNMLTQKDVTTYSTSLINAYNRIYNENTQVVICPSSPHYHIISSRTQMHRWLSLGAQDMAAERSGALTGEISPVTLKDGGVQYVLLGHSECRHIGHQTNEEIAQKMTLALQLKLVPVLLIGETAHEHDQDMLSDVLRTQLTIALRDVALHDIAQCIIGYEPVWAIGSGKTPTIDEIVTARIVIRKILMELYNDDAIRKIPILYGGSVIDKTAHQIVHGAEIDGVVVGGASLNPAHLVRIVSAINDDN